jgi:hypothetical protein
MNHVIRLFSCRSFPSGFPCYLRVMKPAAALKESVGEKWIPAIYRDQIRVLRTRSFQLGITARKNDPEILYTLLGIELKVGRKRISCPDLSTARYLRVFARIGMETVAVPYDISKIAALADELESSWQYTLLLLERSNLEKTQAERGRIFSALKRSMREEINEIGAGAAMPEFKQTTKQQKYHQNKK